MCSTLGVQPRGLGGWLYITCDNPAGAMTNKITLCKQHRNTVPEKENPFCLLPTGNAIFDINAKTSSGTLYAGIGERHLNNFLATLNLPQISHKSLKKREVEIVSVLKSYANQSADNALLTEQKLTQQEVYDTITSPVGIEVSKESAPKIWEGDTYVSNIGQEKENLDIVEMLGVEDVSLPLTGNVSYVTLI